MEGHHGDTDETLFIQNLQSISDYVRAAQVSFILHHHYIMIPTLHYYIIITSSLYHCSYVIITSPQGLLTRVEDAVDKFLYWDEEVNIIEAVTSVRHYIIITSF